MSTTLLYKYRKVDENTLSIFINDEVYFSSVESFNDPFDGQLNLFDGLKAFVENSEELEFPDDDSKIKTICDDANKELADTGVFSLSSTNNQILMWSHYADHHKGICIGFSGEGLMEEFRSTKHPTCYDVLYDESKPFVKLLKDYRASGLRPFDFLDADVFQILVEYKHENWNYEREVRFLRSLVGPAKINPNNIKSVIYGIRTQKKHKKLISNLLGSRKDYAHVKEYQMKRIPGALEIIGEEVCSSDFEVDGDGRDFRYSKEETCVRTPEGHRIVFAQKLRALKEEKERFESDVEEEIREEEEQDEKEGITGRQIFWAVVAFLILVYFLSG